ncbi:MAG: YicC family protein [Rhodocyclales bacterium]|nr:YicC family protein [Rhodocyclales bacterium]
MVYSMTGYAAVTRNLGSVSLQLELRSVNSRYLDPTFRIPEELRFAEPMLRDLIGASLTRGKVECRANLQAATQGTPELAVNTEMLQRLAGAQAQVRALLPEAAPLSSGEILRWPGVMVEETLSQETLAEAMTALGKKALEELRASRAREGAKLVTALLERVTSIRAKLAVAAPLIPAAVEEYRNRMTLRLREAMATLDDDRIRQEVTLFAQRVDVAEELTRLTTHLDEVERVLAAGGAVGKRLDFLMQELNREANTLASKSVSAELTGISVDLKVYIEQMREQVQNLE